jgi:hypothetical protein
MNTTRGLRDGISGLASGTTQTLKTQVVGGQHAESQVRTCLSLEFAFLGPRNCGFSAVVRAGTSGLGRQRHARRGNLWPKGGDASRVAASGTLTGKRRAVTADECGVEPARSDQQLDQPRIGFGCR